LFAILQSSPGSISWGFTPANRPICCRPATIASEQNHLLASDLDAPLGMTCGNVSDEPIAVRVAGALERRGGVAGHFLIHDRPPVPLMSTPKFS
jgi:hydrogenase maturation protein HypF